MKANVETLEGNKVKLSVELDEKEVDQAIEAAFRKISRQVNIPGFRPGKAPRKLIEARVGIESARAQALNDAIPDFYKQALQETDTDAVNTPQVSITDGEEEGPTVTFEAEVEVRPVPQIAGYDGLKVTVPNPEPSDEELDVQIDRMRAQDGQLEPVERAAKAGDFLTIDIEGQHEGEPVPGLTASDYSYEVGNKLQSLGEDFDSQVEGSKAGDTKEFTSPVPPNDDEVDFKVEVKVVNELKLPELTDEWASDAGYESVEDARSQIAERMREARRIEALRALRNGSIEALAELVDDELPEPLIDFEMQRVLRDFAQRLAQQGLELGQYLAATGQPQEQFVEQIRSNAIDAVRADLGLRSLAAKEGLEASDEEVDAEVEALAQQFGEKVAAVRRQLERAEQMPAVRSDIQKAKAVRWLMDHVEIVDSEGKTIDRESLKFDSDEDDHDHSGHDHDHSHEDEGNA